MKKQYLSTVIILVGFFLFFAACVTNKNTPVYREFHNVNARWNGYFLADQELKETIKGIEKGYKEDYTQLLPIYIYPADEKAAKKDTAALNKVIKRATSVIQRHCIVSGKGKVEVANACKWIDENYTVIGIADLYKLEMLPALEIFEYVSKKYPDPEAKYRGMLWMMRAYNQLGGVSKTTIMIDELNSANDFPKDKKYKRDLELVSADCYIKRSNYPAAIKALNEVVKLVRKKSVKARYHYILAQLYTESGDYKNAIACYEKVIKEHPVYEMVFNAKMSLASIYATYEHVDGKQIKRELVRMSKDEKNEEYLDQIYYSIALLTYKEKDTVATLHYLDKAIEKGYVHKSQKALSFLKRGDVYLDMQNYKKAEMNYDSAMALLPQEFPDYVKIENKKKSLSALVENLNVIALQDSLQVLAKMTEKEREKAIDKMIDNLKAQEAAAAEEAKRQQLMQQQFVAKNQTPVDASQSAGAWYFYNPTNISLGIADFTNRWGNRKLEDNWRRSQKPQELDLDNDSSNITIAADSAAKMAANNSNIKDREYYLKTIPYTHEELEESTAKIIDAYYNVGVIYKEQLNNNRKSIQAFEDLLSRYPNNKYKLTAYYQLYRSYLAVNNTPKAEYYKNILLNDYPETEYAKLIKNPNYAKDLMASKNDIEKKYNETYQLYTSGNYIATIANCNLADSLYSKSPIMPQFDLLKALSIGKTQDKQALEASLTQIIIKYPLGPVKDRAQKILDLMKNQPTVKVDTVKQKPLLPDANDTVPYHWITVVTNNKGDINKFNEKVTMISQTAFAKDNLNITIEGLDNSSQIVNVKTLIGKTKAKEYYSFMKDKEQVFSDLSKRSYQSFLISSDDYNSLQKDKDVNKYLQRFNEKLR